MADTPVHEVLRHLVAPGRDIQHLPQVVHIVALGKPDVTNLARGEQVVDCLEHAVPAHALGHEQCQAGLLDEPDHLARFLQGHDHRLGDDDVLASLEGLHDLLVVARARREHRHRIDVRPCEQLCVAVGDEVHRELVGQSLQPLAHIIALVLARRIGVEQAAHSQARVGNLVDPQQQCPQPRAHDAEPDLGCLRAHHGFISFRSTIAPTGQITTGRGRTTRASGEERAADA